LGLLHFSRKELRLIFCKVIQRRIFYISVNIVNLLLINSGPVTDFQCIRDAEMFIISSETFSVPMSW
jgi:hypothetical protein